MRFAQWTVGVIILAAAGTGTVYLLSPGEATRLRRERDELERQKQQLQEAVARLASEDRVAEVYVTDQIRRGELFNGQPATSDQTIIEFIELDREQHPLPSRRFIIADNVVFFDALVLKFDAEQVAVGDALRGKSLALFRRIYGEHQNPSDGFPIDPDGKVPSVLRVDPEPSEFEMDLWRQFWDLASDPELAAEKGVRVAQGEAVYVPMERGQVWTLTLQNNGGLSIKLRRQAADPSFSGPSDAGRRAPAGAITE